MIHNLIRHIRLFLSPQKEPYFLFYNVLGFYPKDIDLYQLATLHSSVSLHTEDGEVLSNERLEFLGDAILNSIISDILFKKFNHEREGFLTNMRSKLVKRDTLNQLALEIGLDKLIQTSKSINKKNNLNIYGNALEAVIGAIYLDYGYRKCKHFIEEKLLKNSPDLEQIADDEENFKSRMIEWCQKKKFNIEFILLNEEMVSSNQHLFHTRLLIENINVSEATGSNKKESQQNASKVAYEILQKTPHLIEKTLKEQQKKSIDS